MRWISAQSRAASVRSRHPRGDFRVYAAAGTGVPLAGHDPVVVAAAARVVRLSDGLVVEAEGHSGTKLPVSSSPTRS